jgi:pimeloyl-ACP methyl ester carboxylesterase
MGWERITTGRGVSCRVRRGGADAVGPPIVFLHGTAGLEFEDPLLESLASSHPVVAPELPGYGESTGGELLDDMLDFALHGWDVVSGLGVERPVLAGHSMGGMIAAEMASLCPDAVAGVVLIAPLGLWLDDHPIPDLFATLPHDVPALLFNDVDLGASLLAGGVDFSDNDALIAFFGGNANRLGMAGKILFPIPDRRLATRLYRLRAPTMLVWGAADRYVPVVYADAWRRLIDGATVEVVPDAGHMVTVERPVEIAALIAGFAARV